MKLTLTIVDSRVKHSPTYYANIRPEHEDYDRVVVDSFDADREVVANALRAIADDIAPVKVQDGPKVHISATDARELQQAVNDAIQRQQQIVERF